MVKAFLNVSIFFGKVLASIIGLLLLIFTLKYITCPVYTFNGGRPFAGEKLYNPYTDIRPEEWRKGNFQIQSYAWGGLTSGRGNTNQEIYDLYKSLGYDIIATSDYQKINRYGEGKPGYVPVYEHGYGIQKSHQVLVGARRVLWKDYPFFQTIHNKQHIINELKKDNELVYLAHPLLRNGYSVDDMKILTGYDGIEVLNNYRFSIDHWDAALSEGNYVTILGNDDAHDISEPNEIGHHCTFINAPTIDKKDILQSLKAGKAFGARIWRPHGETIEAKIKRTKVLPKLIAHDLFGDTLTVAMDSVVKEIRFVGQNGKLLQKSDATSTASYVVQPGDTYVRAEVHFGIESAYFMNPVCRYNGITPAQMPPPEVNILKTWLLRIIGFATLLFLFLNYFLIRRRLAKEN